MNEWKEQKRSKYNNVKTLDLSQIQNHAAEIRNVVPTDGLVPASGSISVYTMHGR